MNKKKIIISIIAIVLVITGVFIYFVLTAWKPPSEDWWLSFDSIDELNQVRNLTKNGKTSELIEFVKGTNNGENVITSKKDAKHFLKILNNVFLPVDPNWKEMIYNSGNIGIKYKMSNGTKLDFTIEPNDPETFEEVIKRTSDNYTTTNITDEIVPYVKMENFDDNSLRIGNGVKAYSFKRHDEEEGSIRETENGFEIRTALNVKNYYVFVWVEHAPSLEAAFEALANVEFAKGAW